MFVDSEDEFSDGSAEDGESVEENGDKKDTDEEEQGSGSDEGSSGSDAAEEDVTTTGRKKKKRNRNKNKKKISNKEARELEEKEHSYASNIYKVQIDELVKEISVTENRKSPVQLWIKNFKEFLSESKPSKSFDISNWEKMLKGVHLPLPPNIQIQEETVQWTPPSSVEIVGSWKSQTSVEKISQVDLAIEIPKDFLRKKDYLNHKYHIKRAIYLGYIAKLLLKRGDQLQFTMEYGNPLKPVLEIECKGFTIRLLVIPPEDYFKVSRFSPGTNNLRFQHFFEKSIPSEEPEFATPNYNMSILTDVLMNSTTQDYICKVLSKNNSYSEAVKLLKVWLHQRSLDKGHGGFSGFIMSAFVLYLSSINKINKLMNSFDVIRLVFKNLSEMDLTSAGISFSPDVSIKDWHLQFDVVFLDSTGAMNYTADMSKFTFKRTKLEAQRALTNLEGAKLSGFQSVFLTSVPFIQNFDHILQIPCEAVYSCIKEDNLQSALNHSGFQWPVVVSILSPLIEKCVGARVSQIDHELCSVPKWDVAATFPNSPEQIRFGFVIVREAAYKLVEKSEEDPIQAQIFKEFWGEKSQLRRFKDGTMCETVVFEEKSKIILEMLKYIFQKHLGLKPNSIKFDYYDRQIEDLVEKGFSMVKQLKKPKNSKFLKGKRKKPSASELMEFTPMELDAIADKASSTFDELAKTLRALEGLPLEVSSVQGTSSVLRFTNVHPTPPQRFQSNNLMSEINKKKAKLHNGSMTFKHFEGPEIPPKVPKVVEPICVILHLETSGKWPDDIEAIDRLKCAFLLRIGQLLKEQFGLIVQPHPRYLDILKEGFVFRIKLTYYRELILLKQHLGADGIMKIRDNPESLRLEKESLLLPQLTTTLHSFQRQFEAFGKTCRMAKRWIASQLLLASPLQYINPEQPDSRFTEESIELLVAHLFQSFAPHLSPPNEAQLGFIRFLYLLSNTDWKSTPIILNFHDKFTLEDVSGVELDFVKRRQQLPPLFIVTPEDRTASIWTKNLAPVVLYRAQLLAKEAVTVLRNSFAVSKIPSVKLEKKPPLQKEEDEHNRLKKIKSIFRPETHEFDTLIHLKRQMNPRSSEQIDSQNVSHQFKEYSKTSAAQELLPIVDFDPVQIYLQKLRSSFGHLALFLHDNYGGPFIAVVWRPEAFRNQDFTVSNVNACQLNSKGKMVPDMGEMLESFEIIGHGLVDHIEKKAN